MSTSYLQQCLWLYLLRYYAQITVIIHIIVYPWTFSVTLYNVNLRSCSLYFFLFVSVLVADLLIYIPAVVLYCLYLTDGSSKKKVRDELSMK